MEGLNRVVRVVVRALGEQVAQWGGKRREILLTATKESEK